MDPTVCALSTNTYWAAKKEDGMENTEASVTSCGKLSPDLLYGV